MSRVIYQFTCPVCKNGQYVGSTSRSLHIRMHEHKGFSYRTNRPVNKPPFSAIREHTETKHTLLPERNNFKILKTTRYDISLKILESLFIKTIKPNLNNTNSSYPLSIV